MKQVGQRGFTLIESMLFIAISGFLLLIAAQTIGNRNQLIQFTDSMRGLEAYLERRQSNIRTGVADTIGCTWSGGTYTFGAQSNGSCIFLGYIFEFGDFSAGAGDPVRSEVYVHQLVGARLTSRQLEECTKPPAGKSPIACAEPVLMPSSTETYQIPWGSEIFGASINGTLDAGGFGVIRQPNSTALVPIIFEKGANVDSPMLYDESFPGLLAGGPRQSIIGNEEGATFCFRSANEDYVAALNFANSFRGESLDLLFDIADAFPTDCLKSGGRFSANF